MNDTLITLLSSISGLFVATTGYLWRAQRRNGGGNSMRDLSACLRELNVLLERQSAALDTISRNGIESQKMLSDALLAFGKAQLELSGTLGLVERRLNDVWIKVM